MLQYGSMISELDKQGLNQYMKCKRNYNKISATNACFRISSETKHVYMLFVVSNFFQSISSIKYQSVLAEDPQVLR